MNRWGITAVAAATLALAGCGTTTATPKPTHAKASVDKPAVRTVTAKPTPTTTQSYPTPQGASPANPVKLLAPFAGCKIPSSEVNGTVDANGDLTASCDYLDNDGQDGTDVTSYTVAAEGQLQALVNSLRPDDSHKIIVGDGFIIEITGDWSAYSKHLTNAEIATIATRLHGQVRTPTS